MEISVKDIKGNDTGRTVALSSAVFGVEPNDHAIYLDVKQYLANQRQGTHKSKERAEIAGSTRKIKKQKGTGTARAGSIKSPVFVGGGRVFGPRPKDYSFKLNKKVKQLARKSALSYKATEQSISILENFSFDAPKTKSFSELLSATKLGESKTLFVTEDTNTNVYLSARNLGNTKVIAVADLNTYDILHADVLVLTEGAIAKLA